MHRAKAPVSRAPRGVDSKNRVTVSLMPDELERLAKRAKQENRSASSLARLFIVAGMDAEDGRALSAS
ncbi:conserved hypothetical protein; putative phage protein [Cupriavidus taiwanensis]|uniref:ribbon-helix-helix domain-containing protein n=1 Tax=Cupriavidus taiwanensis TaxID=164546 RepID=UPI000E1A21AF|nr:hypothetical protein [Cupriavidus taiwanensis]SOZ27810.1 conserved hypothetical protein; putative phage protein [Cupriavidus taiwanensis]SPA14258.1 conserved hypothetical protein; putative phage protein [Cupriavidus taiwanensis]